MVDASVHFRNHFERDPSGGNCWTMRWIFHSAVKEKIHVSGEGGTCKYDICQRTGGHLARGSGTGKNCKPQRFQHRLMSFVEQIYQVKHMPDFEWHTR